MTTPNLLALTSMTPTLLVSTRISVTTDTSVYTVPSGKAVKLSQGSLANVSGSAVAVGLSIIPSGGSADQTHKVVPDTYILAAGDTLPLGDYISGHFLGDGDKIAVHAAATNAIDLVLSGVVMG